MNEGAAGTVTDRPLSRWTRLYYGMGSIAYGVKDNGFAWFLLIYYDQVLGLPAERASLAIFLALVVDAFSDPIVGGISDRLRARWGRRHPFMYVAIVPVTLAYVALWNPPELSTDALFWYLVFVAIAVRTLITLFEVPNTALGPELTPDYDERTRLMALRYFFGWAGGVSIAVIAYAVLFVPTDVYPTAQLNPTGYHRYGLVAAGMMFFGMLASSLGTHREIPRLRTPPPQARTGFWGSLRETRETLSNGSFAALFGFALFAAMANGVVAALNIYFHTFFWELSSDQIALLVPSSFVSAILSLTLSPRLSQRFGKRRAAIAIAVAAGTFGPVPVVLRLVGWMPENGASALLPLLIAHNVLEVAFIMIASTLVASMMADVVEQSELRTGRRSEGTFYAARTFIHKSVSGLGLVVATTLLGAVAFPEDAVVGEIPADTLRNLGIGYAPLVSLLYGGAILCLLGYRITRQDHEAHLAHLRETEKGRTT